MNAVAVGDLDGLPIAVTGGKDPKVRVWDLRTGRQHGDPLKGHTDSVLAVAVGDLDGLPIAVTGGYDAKRCGCGTCAPAAQHGRPLKATTGG